MWGKVGEANFKGESGKLGNRGTEARSANSEAVLSGMEGIAICARRFGELIK